MATVLSRPKPPPVRDGRNGHAVSPAARLAGVPDNFVPLTVDQYHRMIGAGILREGEPIHLRDGFLVRKDRSKVGDDPMTVGPDHALAVKKLIPLDARLRRLGCHLQIEQPVTLPPDNEPEPDGAIVRGRPEDYRGRHPGAGDLLCTIEVADSSLHEDRVTMQRIYADHGIPQYVLVNLIERVVEVYTRPLVGQGRYAQVDILRLRQRVEFHTGGRPLVVPVRSLLP
jgi:hypothetical protein